MLFPRKTFQKTELRVRQENGEGLEPGILFMEPGLVLSVPKATRACYKVVLTETEPCETQISATVFEPQSRTQWLQQLSIRACRYSQLAHLEVKISSSSRLVAFALNRCHSATDQTFVLTPASPFACLPSVAGDCNRQGLLKGLHKKRFNKPSRILETDCVFGRVCVSARRPAQGAQRISAGIHGFASSSQFLSLKEEPPKISSCQDVLPKLGALHQSIRRLQKSSPSCGTKGYLLRLSCARDILKTSDTILDNSTPSLA